MARARRGDGGNHPAPLPDPADSVVERGIARPRWRRSVVIAWDDARTGPRSSAPTSPGQPKTATVAVRLTVTVDPAAWQVANGEKPTPMDAESLAAISADVRRHALTLVKGSALIEEAGGTVRLA